LVSLDDHNLKHERPVLTIFGSAAGKFGHADIEARVEELASLPADWA
jgi:hypothetical protein